MTIGSTSPPEPQAPPRRAPPAAPPAGPVRRAYDRLVRGGSIADDPAQHAAADLLDSIISELSPAERLLARLRPRPPVRGAYIHGAVGRGKTMLMDLFFSLAPVKAKRRVHFHAFMDEVHAAIAAARAGGREGGEKADPVEAAVRAVAPSLRLLCLDEFHVTDITNAMLLGRLFERLFKRGVVLVATSNTAPRALYENGLNRELFLPFIDLLERHASVLELGEGRDFRRTKFAGESPYAFGPPAETAPAMDRLWLRLTGGAPGAPESLETIGRRILVPLAVAGAARFRFADLCEAPLGPRDFLRVAAAFDAVLIEDVPRLERARADAARRFILLVDSLYDRGVKLAASFAVPLDELARGTAIAGDFERTVSRLIEMRSQAYLEAPARPAASPGP